MNSEDRMYVANTGFLIVNCLVLFVALIAINNAVPAVPALILAGFIAAIGNPCVVLVVWGDGIKDVIDHFFALFKKKEKE
jgi:hypothetical protein